VADLERAAPGEADKRASDADRDRVVDRLRDAAAEGRLDLTEFEERMGAAYAARTYGELAPLTADLPDQQEAAAPAHAQEVLLRAHGSSVRREGRWPVPRRLVVRAEHGSVRLDLTRAVVLAAEVEVHIEARHSSVVLLVPRGTEAFDDGLVARWSSTSYGGDDSGDGPRSRLRLRLTGEAHHSSVNVRSPNIFDQWDQRIRSWWRRLLRAG
jgi:hypothetical protein